MGGVSITLPRAREIGFSEPTREDGKTPIVRCADKDEYRTLKQIDQPGTTVIVSETLYQAKIHPELCSVHPDEPFSFAEKAYAVSRADEQFIEYVDQFVHLSTHDGTYQEYEDEWMK